MKKNYTKTAYFILFLGIIYSCTKEADVLFSFPFKITETHVVEGHIYEQQETAFNIILERSVENVDLFLEYKITSGKGYYQDKDGNKLEPGTSIKLNDLEWKYQYIPTEIGEHKVLFLCTSTENQKEELIIDYNIKYAPFSVILNKGDDVFIINSDNAINLTLLRDKFDQDLGKSSDEFSISYVVEKGTGIIKSKSENLKPGDSYKFNKGINDLKYYPTTLGEHIIKVKAIASDGATKTIDFIVNVNQTDFSFSANFATPFIPLGNQNTVNFNISPKIAPSGSGNKVTYKMKFISNLNGTLKYKGVDYSAGELITVDEGEFTGVFNPEVVGNYEVIFTLTDSNEATKDSVSKMEVDNSEFSFSVTPNPQELFVTESTFFNIDLKQVFTNLSASYEISYNLKGGNGVLSDANGNVVQPGVFIPIGLGANQWNFETQTNGALIFDFTVRDNTNNTKEASVTLNVKSKDFILEASPSKISEFTGVSIPIITTISELSLNSGDTYKLYVSSNRNGNVSYDGLDYTLGQRFNVNTGNFTIDYNAYESGAHNIIISVVSSSGKTNTTELSLMFNEVLYTLSVGASESEIFRGENTSLNFNISESGGNSTYNMVVQYPNNTGSIIDQDGNLVLAGQTVSVPTGNFSWTFTGTNVGNIDMLFSVINATGSKKTASSSVKVKQRDFTFNAIAGRPSLFVNESVNITGVITELSSGNDTYTMSFSNTKYGTLKIGSTIYYPGQTITVQAGSTNIEYTGLETEEHRLVFSVTSSSGVTKKSSVPITFNEVDYSFTAIAQSVSIDEGDTTNINFDISELSGSSTYEIKYILRSGNVTVIDQNGNEAQPGVNVTVPSGSSTWTVTGNFEGNVVLDFYSKNATGLEKTAFINMTVIKYVEPFTITSTLQNSRNVEGTDIPMNVNVTAANHDPNVTYAVKYSFAGTNQGTIRYKGVTYNVNDEISLDYGNNNMIFQSTNNEDFVINFDAKNSTGETSSINKNIDIYIKPKPINVYTSLDFFNRRGTRDEWRWYMFMNFQKEPGTTISSIVFDIQSLDGPQTFNLDRLDVQEERGSGNARGQEWFYRKGDSGIYRDVFQNYPYTLTLTDSNGVSYVYSGIWVNNEF